MQVKIDSRRESAIGSRTGSTSVVIQYALHDGTSARGCTRCLFSACPFYGFARDATCEATDSRGEAPEQEALVEKARHGVDEHGFQARKRWAGILE